MYLRIYDTPADGLESAEGQLNAGGIRRLRLIQADQLQLIKPDRFPRPGLAGYADYTLADQHLIFAAGATLTDIEIIPAYADFSENADSDSHGTFYKPSIQLTLPKIRPAVSIWIHRNQEVRWVAFIADRNGFYRCVGTPEQSLRLEISQGTGAGSGRNQTALTFSVGIRSKSYRLTELYRTKTVTDTITDPSFIRKIHQVTDCNNETAVKVYYYLTRWAGGLMIKAALAYRYAEAFLAHGQQILLSRPKRMRAGTRSLNPKTQREKLYCRHANLYQSIDRIRRGDHYFTVDDHCHRLHTVLTNLKSDLRHALAYQGQSLVSIDLSSSQIY